VEKQQSNGDLNKEEQNVISERDKDNDTVDGLVPVSYATPFCDVLLLFEAGSQRYVSVSSWRKRGVMALTK
jgi:hypothetical protein